MKAEEVIKRFKEQYGVNTEHPDCTSITYGGITVPLYTTAKIFLLAIYNNHLSRGHAPYQITEEFVKSLEERGDNER